MSKRYKKALTVEEISNLSDDNIDCTDIPELDDNFWTRAKISPPQNKPSVSLRISPEVLDFFKSETPKGYTSKMAAVLQSYYEAHKVQ